MHCILLPKEGIVSVDWAQSLFDSSVDLKGNLFINKGCP